VELLSDEKGPRRQTTPQGRILDDCANCGKYGRIHSNTSGQELCKNCSGIAKAFEYTWQLMKYVDPKEYAKDGPKLNPMDPKSRSKKPTARMNDTGDIHSPQQLERLKELARGPRKAPPRKEKPYE